MSSLSQQSLRTTSTSPKAGESRTDITASDTRPQWIRVASSTRRRPKQRRTSLPASDGFSERLPTPSQEKPAVRKPPVHKCKTVCARDRATCAGLTGLRRKTTPTPRSSSTSHTSRSWTRKGTRASGIPPTSAPSSPRKPRMPPSLLAERVVALPPPPPAAAAGLLPLYIERERSFPGNFRRTRLAKGSSAYLQCLSRTTLLLLFHECAGKRRAGGGAAGGFLCHLPDQGCSRNSSPCRGHVNTHAIFLPVPCFECGRYFVLLEGG